MVVWLKPCKSRSSPGPFSKTPHQPMRGFSLRGSRLATWPRLGLVPPNPAPAACDGQVNISRHKTKTPAWPGVLYGAGFADQAAASFSFFSGRTLSLVEAGLAANQVSSLVNGLMPLRFGLAGTFTAVIFSTPGSTNWPAPFLLMEAWIAPSRAASTARTSLAATWLASAMCATSPDLFRASLIGFGAAALAGAFLAGAAFFLAICVDSSVSWLRGGWPEWITVRCGGISRGEFHRRLCHQYDHAGEAAQPGEAAQLVDGGQVEDPVQDAEGDECDGEQADAPRVHAGELRHQHRRGERRECLEGVEVGGVGVADAVAVLLRQPAARVLVVVAGCAALGDEGPCIGQQGGDQDAPVGNRHVSTPRAGAMVARLADPNARGAVFRLVSGNFFRVGRRRDRRTHGIARRLERVALVPVRP